MSGDQDVSQPLSTKARRIICWGGGAICAVLLVPILGLAFCVKAVDTTPEQSPVEEVDGVSQNLALLTARNALRDQMNDPDSLKIVESRVEPTVLADGNPGLVVHVLYRGKNALGGTMTKRAMVSTDASGQTLMAVVRAD